MRSVITLTFLRSRQRGVAAVELALLLTPLVAMLFGVTELGRAVYTYNVLDKTVRDAARHLSQNGVGNPTVQFQAKCLAATGNIAITTTSSGTVCQEPVVATGLTSDMVKLCDALLCPGTNANQATGSGSINLVSVSISGYTFTSLASFVIPNMTFKPISVTMRGQL